MTTYDESAERAATNPLTHITFPHQLAAIREVA